MTISRKFSIFRSLPFMIAAVVCLAFTTSGYAFEGSEGGIVGYLGEIASRTRLGGWLDFLYTDSDKNDGRKHFDLHHFYLYVDSDVADRWRLFGEMEFGHAPHLEDGENKGELKLERGYLQYSVSDPIKFRFGKFNTPFGIWTPTHWAVYVDTVRKPIHEDNKYIPLKSVGVSMFGDMFFRFPSGEHGTLRYHLFVSNGGEYEGTDSPEDDHLGFGSDVSVNLDGRYLMGFSAYTRKNANPSYGTPGRRETSLNLYGETSLPWGLTLRGEWVVQDRSSGDRTIDTWYGKVKWRVLESAYVNYRYESGDDEKRAGGGRHKVHTFTVGYWPLPEVRLKGEVSLHDFKEATLEDYTEWTGWIGCVF